MFLGDGNAKILPYILDVCKGIISCHYVIRKPLVFYWINVVLSVPDATSYDKRNSLPPSVVCW